MTRRRKLSGPELNKQNQAATKVFSELTNQTDCLCLLNWTFRHLEGFRPLCISGDVEVTHTSNLAVKVSGNVLQYKQDPFTGEFLAVSTIRSNEIKEPFVFNAFEDNNMTLFVQPKDQNTPMSGCLSFWRKLEHIR